MPSCLLAALIWDLVARSGLKKSFLPPLRERFNFFFCGASCALRMLMNCPPYRRFACSMHQAGPRTSNLLRATNGAPSSASYTPCAVKQKHMHFVFSNYIFLLRNKGGGLHFFFRCVIHSHADRTVAAGGRGREKRLDDVLIADANFVGQDRRCAWR